MLGTLAKSLSSRRAWIEIVTVKLLSAILSRSPHGERGLKFRHREGRWNAPGRSPHGERGLKYISHLHGLLIGQVALLTESVD